MVFGHPVMLKLSHSTYLKSYLNYNLSLDQLYTNLYGVLAEWTKAAVLKTVGRVRVPKVRILDAPPTLLKNIMLFVNMMFFLIF